MKAKSKSSSKMEFKRFQITVIFAKNVFQIRYLRFKFRLSIIVIDVFDFKNF